MLNFFFQNVQTFSIEIVNDRSKNILRGETYNTLKMQRKVLTTMLTFYFGAVVTNIQEKDLEFSVLHGSVSLLLIIQHKV